MEPAIIEVGVFYKLRPQKISITEELAAGQVGAILKNGPLKTGMAFEFCVLKVNRIDEHGVIEIYPFLDVTIDNAYVRCDDLLVPERL